MICKSCAEAGDRLAAIPSYILRTTRAHQLLKVKALHKDCQRRGGCTCQHRTPLVTQV